MVTEIAIFQLDPKKADAFEKMAAEVMPKTLRNQKGYISDNLFHAIEKPEEYILTVEWEDVNAHKAFIGSKDYPLMAESFGEYVLKSSFAHYKSVLKA